MNAVLAIVYRELRISLATPLASLFIVAYALLSTIVTFELGDFYARGEADLTPGIAAQPWLLVWLAPALSMRFWAEDRRHGTHETLLTQPVGLASVVVGKWLAGVCLLTVAMASTLPLWGTVAFLGRPDHGMIAAGYVGTWLLGAALLAVGSAWSASTRHQITAFIATSVTGILLLLAGHPVVTELLRDRIPVVLLESVVGLSGLSHHQALSRGVISLTDVVYFSGLVAAGLWATAVVIQGVRALPVTCRGRRLQTGVAVAGIVTFLVTILAITPRVGNRVRLDITEEHLYTLGSPTRRLLDSLEEPVTLTLYASARTLALSPPHSARARRLKELLSDIAAQGPGRVHFRVIDPPPFSDLEDRAAEAGLRSVPIGEGGDSLWLGVVAESTNRHATIDFLDPEDPAFYEYQLARIIRQVARPQRPVIGLVSTLPNGPLGPSHEGGRPWVTDEQLREQYDVRDIPPEAEQLPDPIAALVILHPKGLNPALLKDVDRFVVRGGHLLLAVDPDAQFDGQADDGPIGSDHASTFEPLLKRWGITFDPARIVGDLDNALLVGAGRGDRPVRHLGFAGFGVGSLASNDPLTQGLHRMDLATPGYFGVNPPPGVKATPLIQTSTSSASFPVSDLLYGATPETLRHGFRPDGKRYTVAVHLRGILPPAFADTAPKQRSSAEVILIADTDWLSDALWIRDQDVGGTRYREPWANNGDFLLNAMDALTGGSELVGLRGRVPKSRPLERLDAIRQHADRRLAAKSEALERRLADVNRQIAALAGDTPGGAATNPQQQGALHDAESERRQIVRAMRGIRYEMEREADRLGRWLYVINLLSAPLLIGGLSYAYLRSRRRFAGR